MMQLFGYIGKIFQMERKNQEAVEKKAKENMNKGMSKDKAYTEAMNDLGVIDYNEYNNIKKACQAKGTWYWLDYTRLL